MVSGALMPNRVAGIDQHRIWPLRPSDARRIEAPLSLAHTTILRWVTLYTPEFVNAGIVGYDSRSVVASRRDLRYAQPT